jgi:hypothetical protein
LPGARAIALARVVLCATRMSRLHILSLALGALALPACLSTSSTGTVAQRIEGGDVPDDVPAALVPAADQRLAFVLDAIGVQEYTCAAAATGYAWKFVAPDAQLYHNDEGEGDHAVGHHFAGPTWEYEDGSFVVGKKVAAVTVDPTAIPWLLLVAASHGGPDGRMTSVTTIQRLQTAAGLAPATGCDADHVGAAASSPYTASYYFWVTRDSNELEQ